jgi:DNA-binding TFAR19-related protein (PDSD5 family)
MLTAYNWKFVEQAQEIRGKAVAQLLEEIEHPDARIRLKAIEILGKVTEIGLFTERVEIKKAEMPDSELDDRIREKLAQLQKTVDMEQAEREKRNADAVDIEAKDADEN